MGSLDRWLSRAFPGLEQMVILVLGSFAVGSTTVLATGDAGAGVAAMVGSLTLFLAVYAAVEKVAGRPSRGRLELLDQLDKIASLIADMSGPATRAADSDVEAGVRFTALQRRLQTTLSRVEAHPRLLELCWLLAGCTAAEFPCAANAVLGEIAVVAAEMTSVPDTTAARNH